MSFDKIFDLTAGVYIIYVFLLYNTKCAFFHGSARPRTECWYLEGIGNDQEGIFYFQNGENMS